MKSVEEYYKSLPIKLAKEIAAKSFSIFIGESGHEGDPCTGCSQTTPFGGCYIHDGQCVWVPEFGK